SDAELPVRVQVHLLTGRRKGQGRDASGAPRRPRCVAVIKRRTIKYTRTTEPRSSGRSFAVGTPRPPLGGAASSALPAACSSLCLCVSLAKYVVVFLK